MLDRHPLRSAAVSARMQRLFPSVACLPFAAAMLGLGISPVSRAATIAVDSTADPSGAGTCTLRQAIVSMNTGAVTGNCVNSGGAFGSSDTVVFAGALFGAGSPTITLADQPDNYLHVTDSNLTIDAGAGRNVTVQRSAAAQNKFPILFGELDGSGTLRLAGLTLQNGYAVYTHNSPWNQKLDKYSFGGFDTAGGGVGVIYGSLALDHCTIRNNTAFSQLGGVKGAGAMAGHHVTVTSSLITGNVAKGAGAMGAGVYSQAGTLSITGSTISGNVSEGTQGGAAASVGLMLTLFGPIVSSKLSIVDSTISGNHSPNAQGWGAAISAPLPTSVLISNSTFACNDAPAGTAAIYILAIDSTRPLRTTSSIFADTSNSRCTSAVSKEIVVHAQPRTFSGDHNLLVSTSALDASAALPADTLFGDALLGPLQNNGGVGPTHALGAGSPALDAGSDPLLLTYDGRGADFTRRVGNAPDIGAYEDQSVHLCGTAQGQSFLSLSVSTPNLCGGGAYLQGGPFGSGPWSWFCASSSDPAQNEFCGAKVLASTSLLVESAGGATISSAVWGQPLHLKAAVSGGGGTPTGTASFFDVTGGAVNPLCADLALSGGETVCDTTSTPIDAGTRQLKVVYNGDATYGKASSSPAGVQINPAASATSLVSQTPNPVALGAPFTVVANVSVNSPSQGSPYGVVQVTDQTDNLTCTYPLGAATPGCALTPVSGGVHALHVTYLGNDNINPSSASGTETVTAPQLSLTIDDGSAYAAYGKTLHYVIHLNNTGNGSASSIAVSGAPGPTFNGAPLSWQCAATNGATCAASGSGATLVDTATLPANSTLTWTVDVVAPQNTGGDTLQFTAIAAGVATVGDTDTLVIFRDGFE